MYIDYFEDTAHQATLNLGFVLFFSVAGDVKFWDPRFTESVRTLDTVGNSAAFEVHHQAKVFAT